MNLADLKLPLPKIHWRAQSISIRNPDSPKAMALAYMDARDVMDRLDDVCGPQNWEDSHIETAKGRIISTIKIWINDKWVSKSDGAGETAMEGEKGGLSDAFKRAAVKWGIGRYLYDMKTPWAECEVQRDREGKPYLKNGKPQFKAWTANGLATLRALEPKGDPEQAPQSVLSFVENLKSASDKGAYWTEHYPSIPKQWREFVVAEKEKMKESK